MTTALALVADRKWEKRSITSFAFQAPLKQTAYLDPIRLHARLVLFYLAGNSVKQLAEISLFHIKL